MKVKFKIFLTNWINLLGIFLAVYLSSAVSELFISGSLVIGFIGGLFAIIFYGSVFWAGFIIAMFLLDFILLDKNKEWLKLKLFIEWTIVSSPFIYWFIQYTQWIFLVAVVAFFITQIIREKRISATI